MDEGKPPASEDEPDDVADLSEDASTDVLSADVLIAGHCLLPEG